MYDEHSDDKNSYDNILILKITSNTGYFLLLISIYYS